MPIHCCAMQGRIDAIKLLLKYGDEEMLKPTKEQFELCCASRVGLTKNRFTTRPLDADLKKSTLLWLKKIEFDDNDIAPVVFEVDFSNQIVFYTIQDVSYITSSRRNHR